MKGSVLIWLWLWRLAFEVWRLKFGVWRLAPRSGGGFDVGVIRSHGACGGLNAKRQTPNAKRQKIQPLNEHGAFTQAASLSMYCFREISSTPNRWRCGVVHCVSSREKPRSRRRVTSACSATFDASVTV